MERKGASYKITEKRAASSHAEHTQRTNATVASEMYGGEKRSYAPMDIRAREYADAKAGRMSKAEMNRVGIDHSKYPSRD